MSLVKAPLTVAFKCKAGAFRQTTAGSSWEKRKRKHTHTKKEQKNCSLNLLRTKSIHLTPKISPVAAERSPNQTITRQVEFQRLPGRSMKIMPRPPKNEGGRGNKQTFLTTDRIFFFSRYSGGRRGPLMAGPGGPPPPADRLPRAGERAGPQGCGGWRGLGR